MVRILDALDRPQERCHFVHIAGTNGKGSVAAMLSAVLTKSGYRTGLYTSPHLVDVRERIRVNEKPIQKTAFLNLIERLRPLLEKYQCTFFEAMTVLALQHFAETKTDIAVLEVGLGGRLDATNVVTPLVSAITSIDYDHIEHLGTSLEEIAKEKAGIVKQNVPVIIGDLPTEAEKEIRSVAEAKNSTVILAHQDCETSGEEIRPLHCKFRVSVRDLFAGRVRLSLVGTQQIRNCAVALAILKNIGQNGIRLETNTLVRGMAQVRWPGRFQIIQKKPIIIADVAHNVQSFMALRETLQAVFPGRKIVFILGLLRDKDYRKIAAILAPISAKVLSLTPKSDRALPGRDLAEAFRGWGITTQIVDSIAQAFEQASLATPEIIHCIAGSHFIVGEVLSERKNLTN